jgi:hypothetical protein
MSGTIAEVDCKATPEVLITLKAQNLVMHLHAPDFAQLAFTTQQRKSAPKVTAGASLRGWSARISYLLSGSKSWDGEIQSIELRSEP